MSENPVLQFTQEDRDLLLRMEGKMDAFIEKQTAHHRRLNNHSARLKNLEADRERNKGERNALRIMWAAIVSLAAMFGVHLAQSK